MELEELIKIYNGLKNHKEIIGSIDTDFFFNFAETVLQELKNSIPKKKIEEKIEELKAQCGGNPYHIQQTLNAEIRLLQELLEDK